MPTFPRAARITVRELLSHTSGIYNYFETPTYNGLVFSTPRAAGPSTRSWPW